MQIPQNYYILKRDYLNRMKNYKDLDIEEKIDLMKLELILNGINVNVQRFHTQAEAEKSKRRK